MDRSKRNIVFVNPAKPLSEMTDEEIIEQVADPLYRELTAQRDAARARAQRADGSTTGHTT